jgi:hypothetical protein
MADQAFGRHLPRLRTSRTSLWVAVAITLALGTGAQAAKAKECHKETPLPADVTLIAPGPDVSQAVAEFAGAWVGAWKNRRGEDTLCQTLVVPTPSLRPRCSSAMLMEPVSGSSRTSTGPGKPRSRSRDLNDSGMSAPASR